MVREVEDWTYEIFERDGEKMGFDEVFEVFQGCFWLETRDVEFLCIFGYVDSVVVG